MARFSGRRRALVMGVCAVAVMGTLGFGGYGVYKAKQSADQCAVQQDRLAARGPFTQVSQGLPKIVVVGDSYTAGEHLTDAKDGWVYKAGPAGWGVEADGIGSTGFLSTGWCSGKTFGDRIDEAVAEAPDAIIIQGGLNDWEKPGDVAAAAERVLETAHNIPLVLVVGPVDAPARSEGAHKVDQALRAAVEAKGRTYVSAIDWPVEFLPDRLHMTPAGHSLFADRVRAALRA